MLSERELHEIINTNDEEQHLRVLRALLKHLMPCYRSYVLAAATAIKVHEGFTTPAEDFVYGVLLEYKNNGSFMRPEDIEPLMEEFRQNWESVNTIVERFAPMLERQQAAA